jgi:hypothetical protein
LNQPGLFHTSMDSFFLEDTVKEFNWAASCSQEIYNVCIENRKKLVSFFENQDTLVEQIHAHFITLPPEEIIHYNSFFCKNTALTTICKKIDPTYTSFPHHLSLDKVDSLAQALDVLSTELVDSGRYSTFFLDFLSQLAGM